MFNRSALARVSLMGLLALGCSKEVTSSSNIRTQGIVALIDVYADTDTRARVNVKLVVGGPNSNTYVDLEGEDELTATADGKKKTLAVQSDGTYRADFDGVGEDSEFSVALTRSENDESASDSSGTLPAPFSLDEPVGELSRQADELEISWDPGSDDDMNLQFHGDCIYPYSKNVADTGSYTVEKDRLDSTGIDKPEACQLTLDAVRTRNGRADSKLDPDSYFRLHQRRGTKFVSNP